MRIFLVGMMGAGKSFYGKKIATTHQKMFLDSDTMIEDFLQKDIASLFELKGEWYFRKIENKILKSTVDKYDDFIMACGGGLPCYANTMNYLQQNGTTVYLKHDIVNLYDNLKNEIAKRPLLRNKNEKEIQSYLSQLLDKRKDVYEKSDIVIEMHQVDECNFVENFYNLICSKHP